MRVPDHEDIPFFPPVAKVNWGSTTVDAINIRSPWFLDEKGDMEAYDEEEERHYQSYLHPSNLPKITRSSRSAQPIPTRDHLHPAHSLPSSITSSPLSSYSPLQHSTPYTSVFEEKPHAHHLLPASFRRHPSHSQNHSSSYNSFSDDTHSEHRHDEHKEACAAEQKCFDKISERDRSIPYSQATDIGHSQAIKKQWAAVSLSVQVSLFRVRKRARSLTSKK